MSTATPLQLITGNLFHPRLVNSANESRMHTARSALKLIKSPGYSLYLDWESSNDDHIRIRAEHHETGISLKLHIYPNPYHEHRVKVSAEGPRWFKKYPIAHVVANALVSQNTKWTRKIRSK